MKKHAIIPIFISHRGCPHSCAFCNQKKITARSGDVTPDDARKTIEEWLTTLGNVETVEVSFYGGSFTAIPMDEQTAFLKLAKEYKDAGKIQKIHLSTRPDYIEDEILTNLRNYSVDVIELGAQSFDDEVLATAERGHTAEDIEKASKLIHEYGFTLGLQLMVGLPGDSPEKCVESARRAVSLKPEIARLYPTVVIKGTKLYKMYEEGSFTPLSQDEMIERTKEMYKIIDDAGIKIIRVGLKSSEIMDDEFGFHPAFRELVEDRIARERIEGQINEMYPELEWYGGIDMEINSIQPSLKVIANEHSFGHMFGHKKENELYFEQKYPMITFSFKKDYEELMDLRDNEYVVDEDYSFDMGIGLGGLVGNAFSSGFSGSTNPFAWYEPEENGDEDDDEYPYGYFEG